MQELLRQLLGQLTAVQRARSFNVNDGAVSDSARLSRDHGVGAPAATPTTRDFIGISGAAGLGFRLQSSVSRKCFREQDVAEKSAGVVEGNARCPFLPP